MKIFLNKDDYYYYNQKAATQNNTFQRKIKKSKA